VKAASVTRNPWFSMIQRSRLKPLRRQTQGCRNESRLASGRAPASNLSVFGAVGGRGGSRASRIDRSLPSLGHRFAQGHCGLPNGIPIPDHWKGRAKRFCRRGFSPDTLSSMTQWMPKFISAYIGGFSPELPGRSVVAEPLLGKADQGGSVFHEDGSSCQPA